MRSFRARRQDSQWGLDDDGGAGTAGGLVAAGSKGLRRGESLRSITVPETASRELGGGRLVNEDAVYRMRKKWISDRLIER